MERNWLLSYLAIIIVMAAASTSISDSGSASLASTTSHLLQVKKANRCCCATFKKFACPYAKQINDFRTDCASTMFSYINLYGKYPPGLFAAECREGKQGLKCPISAPTR
ncbi:hypothetical protein E1A91_A13G130100v1 [Gossypium mustelinum]|uniref:GPI-anchored protein LLG1-like domain-containing protein n=2 Tax=Gossypium TaxID=3633 RepID=A0A5D2WHT7_GOSMU|nr:hypothetical protein E1A91_A13G130100v1 [Gossypium mustelinum]